MVVAEITNPGHPSFVIFDTQRSLGCGLFAAPSLAGEILTTAQRELRTIGRTHGYGSCKLPTASGNKLCELRGVMLIIICGPLVAVIFDESLDARDRELSKIGIEIGLLAWFISARIRPTGRTQPVRRPPTTRRHSAPARHDSSNAFDHLGTGLDIAQIIAAIFGS